MQIFVPESYLEELNNKISSRTETGFISGGYQIILRKCVIEGFHSLVQSFRDKRWSEIQDCVNGIISELSGEDGQQTNDDESKFRTMNITLMFLLFVMLSVMFLLMK